MSQSGGQLQGSGLQWLFYSKENVQCLGCKQVHCEAASRLALACPTALNFHGTGLSRTMPTREDTGQPRFGYPYLVHGAELVPLEGSMLTQGLQFLTIKPLHYQVSHQTIRSRAMLSFWLRVSDQFRGTEAQVSI